MKIGACACRSSFSGGLTNLSVFLHFFANLQKKKKSGSTRIPLKTVGSFRFSWKAVQRKPYFAFQHKLHFAWIFYFLRPTWIHTGSGDVYKNVYTTLFRENQHSESRALFRSIHWISVSTFHMYCPRCVKFDVRDLHKIPLIICKCRKNRRREGRAFITGVNEITSRCVPWDRLTLRK